jgi:ParB family transcriptional regulator, chromosome partitioning protein
MSDPNQPRRQFDEQELKELERSIEARGIKQPLTVRWNQQDSLYMIIDGGRRFEAATRLNLEELPCWIQAGEGRDILIDQIVHNWQRSDLRPYETADALSRLRDEFGLSQTEIASVTGKSKAEISKFLALHDKVVPEVQKLARGDFDSNLSRRHLYSLSRIAPEEQPELADRIVRENLTADRTEQITRAASHKEKPTIKKRRGIQMRQMRFKTSKADVLMTFHKQSISEQDIATTVAELTEQIDMTPS